MDLYARKGGGGGGAYPQWVMWASKKAGKMTDFTRQNNNFTWKKLKENIVLFVYSLIKKNITPEIVPLAQKSELTRSYGMAYARGGRGGGGEGLYVD